MINKAKLSVCLLPLLFHVFVVSADAESTGQLNLLKDIRVEKGAETLTIRLEFNKPLKKNPQPMFYQKSVQLDFPDAFVIPAKRTFATQDSLIAQVFAVQQDPETLRVRFILGDMKRGIKDSFHMERKGNGLVVRVDKNPKDVLDKFIANVKQANASNGKAKEPPVSKPLPISTPSAITEDAPLSATKIQTEAADVLTDSVKVVPAEAQKTEPKAEQKTVSKEEVATKIADAQDKTPDFLKYKEPSAPEPPSLMASGWKMFYTLALVLALMFFIFYVFKKVVLKNTALGGNERLIKVLGTGYLGPKKTVTVVDVAGEILVLGISDGNISLLTQIHDDERIEKLRNGNNLGKILSRIGEPKPKAKPGEIKPEEAKPVENQANNKLFNKYIKQFASDAESAPVSPASNVAELIRKNRERIKAAS